MDHRPVDREDVDPPSFTPFWRWVGGVTLTGFTVAAWALAGAGWTDLPGLGTAFWLLAALVILGELRPLVVPGTTDVNGVVTSTAFVFALLLHWGLAPAVALQAVATVLADGLKRKSLWRIGFNVGQYALSYAAAAVVLQVFHRGAGLGAPLAVDGGDLPVIALAGLAFFAVNDALVSRAIALHERAGFLRVVRADLGFQVVTTGALLALSPLVVVVMERSAALLPLFVLPLVAVYKNAAVSMERDHQALHDALTGLPNRKLLQERAEAALADAARPSGRVALCLLDLDRFKEVNDTLGHPVGDRLLQLVARRLEAGLRPGDTVARLGGDEFALLLPAVRDGAAAVEVASRVRALLTEPFHLEGMTFDLEASVGVAVHPQDGHDVEALLQRADVAMYLAKEGRTGLEAYCADRDRNSTTRLGLLGELRRAMADGLLELHYQPKARLGDGSVVGVEALCRWPHPERGMVPPDEFVPLAEQSGLMRELTRYVLDRALAQAARWQGTGYGVPIAVNVSMRDLHDPAFTGVVAETLARHGVPPRALQLEVTEGMLMADPARASQTLRELHRLGVELSLDDFGTGYSSLAHLKRLPVTEIKIDRTFVGRMDADADDAAIVRSIVELGRSLGLRVVAEGVETRAAWDQLTGFGCHVVQGWYVGRPMPVGELDAWLAELARPPLRAVPAG